MGGAISRNKTPSRLMDATGQPLAFNISINTGSSSFTIFGINELTSKTSNQLMTKHEQERDGTPLGAIDLLWNHQNPKQQLFLKVVELGLSES